MISTGKIILEYLTSNGFSMNDLVEASGVSARTIFRMISSDESKLTYEVASAVHELIPEIDTAFLMKYDAEYQTAKKDAAKKAGVESIDKVIKEYKLDKLYPEIKTDKLELFKVGQLIFGETNIRNNFYVDVNNLTFNYSKASNSDEHASLLWLKTAYEECKNKDELVDFNEDGLNEIFGRVKQLSGASDIRSVLFNMRLICKRSGINFYFRPSIPNSRVKAVTVRDKQGYVYIFVSDLFKCIENLWIAFVHEIMHIRNHDFEKTNLIKNDDIDENENYINEEAIKYFIGSVWNQRHSFVCDLDTITLITSKTNAPSNIVAEIVRFITGNYGEKSVNKLIHYYKSEEIDLNE